MKSKLIKSFAVGIAMIALAVVSVFAPKAYADVGFSMSPMKQKIVLDPGEVYQTSLTISNPGTNDEDFKYKISVSPFYVNEDYNTVFERNGIYSEIVDWITLDSPDSGSIEPNESREIYFTINVPATAPSGGQYASIVVSSDAASGGEGLMINEQVAIGHIIFAEITGDTQKQAEFVEVSVPSFIFSGDITGTAAIKNTGNTHGEAKYILQVYPLFSNEEVYSNEEDPITHIIIPDRTYYNSDAVWRNTPQMGIFNVVYTVEYEGVTRQVSKMVIKCPIWLLFVMLAAIVAVIFWFVSRAVARSKGKR